MDKIPSVVIEALAEAYDGFGLDADKMDEYRDAVYRALRAPEAAGWVLVPVEATSLMRDRGYAAIHGMRKDGTLVVFPPPGPHPLVLWKMMLDVRPRVTDGI